MPARLAVRGALSRAAFALAVLVSLVVLFAPPDDVPGALPGVDKLVHAGLFAALALTGRWAGTSRTVLAVALLGYAGASEVVQQRIGRDASVGDLVADVVGLLVALVCWDRLCRRRDRTPDRLA